MMYKTAKPRGKKAIEKRITELEPYADIGRPWHKENPSAAPQSYIQKCRAEIRILEWVLGKRIRPWYNIEDTQE